MNAIETNLLGCFIVEPKVFNDNRGSFFESFNQDKFNQAIGDRIMFVQDNQSFSTKGVLRGLHFQKGNFAQSKLVRVVKGKVLDVCLDIRKESPTFGKHFSILLDGINNKQLYIPKGFAHGFVVLEDDTIFSYKCDNYYEKSSERGIIYNDKDLDIDWQLSSEELILSEKDQLLPTFKDFVNG
ncbi:MAG: dTDP-4-dehydrorhamnose 3,5-epimerase [Algibacter sp.]